MAVGTALHWPNVPTIAVSVALAFFFGYALTMRPLLRSGLSFASATRLALAADTLSIAVMELGDNGIMLLVPGAMDAHLADLSSGPRSWPPCLSPVSPPTQSTAG